MSTEMNTHVLSQKVDRNTRDIKKLVDNQFLLAKGVAELTEQVSRMLILVEESRRQIRILTGETGDK